jgi:hypothetical protein
VRGIERLDSQLYRARTSTADLYIETRSCFEFPGVGGGAIVRQASGAVQLIIEGAGACDVTDLYFSDPPFGTYTLSRIDRVNSNLYRAESGAAKVFIETRLCLALTLLDDGLLAWQGIGSQVFIDNSSGDVCDVVEVYVN